jgi:hypothetical protein
MVETVSGTSAPDALTTGRAGRLLAIVNRMREAIERSRAPAETADGAVAAAVAWRLQRMQEACFAAEAVAYETAGLLQRPQTHSLRLELAACRVFLGEMLHRVLSASAEITFLGSQEDPPLVAKRDVHLSRIGRSGTLQRFLILKELTVKIAPRWAGHTAPARPQHLGREALELEALGAEFRRLVGKAVDMLGDGLWQDPNLQANCFFLADAAVWLKAADSSLGRLAWWGRRGLLDEDADPSPRLTLARYVFTWCGREVGCRLQRFEEDLADLHRGYYAPEIRAAALLLRRVDTSR